MDIDDKRNADDEINELYKKWNTDYDRLLEMLASDYVSEEIKFDIKSDMERNFG